MMSQASLFMILTVAHSAFPQARGCSRLKPRGFSVWSMLGASRSSSAFGIPQTRHFLWEVQDCSMSVSSSASLVKAQGANSQGFYDEEIQNPGLGLGFKSSASYHMQMYLTKESKTSIQIH